MIFVDSNIPMYLVGADHPNKTVAARELRRLIESEARLVSNVEVVQEILHRYRAIHRLEAIDPAMELLTGIADEIFDLTLADVLRAKEMVVGDQSQSARDAVHVAVMERLRIDTILTFDRAFDQWPGLNRLPSH